MFDEILKFASLFVEAANRNDYMREYMKNRYHSTREKIYNRLGNKCAKCGLKDGPFHLDHIDKKKKTMRAADLHSVNDRKFEDELKNIQLLCPKCHLDKTREAWDFSVNKPKHGTYWMYKKYNCRCKKCQKAYDDYLE